jgi:hypothetical protein
MKCGQPIRAAAPEAQKTSGTVGVQRIPSGRKRALAISITISAVLLAVLILILALSANPVAGRWYSAGGTELIFLKNGKGMTVTDGEEQRIHFMYAIGYKEAGYIEGEIYEKEHGGGTWFYVYDGRLEFGGEYFYRQKTSAMLG